MANDHSAPFLSIVNGPGKKQLIGMLGELDFSHKSPVSFSVRGLSVNLHLAVRQIECVGESGDDFIVGGWWVNNPSSDRKEIVRITYSTQTRKGRITHLV